MAKTIRAQAMAEYIVVLALALIFVSVIVLIIVEQQSSSGNLQERARTAEYAKLPIGINKFDISLTGTHLTLVNNLGKRIELTNITVNGVNLNSSQLPYTLLDREVLEFQSYSILLSPNQQYDYSIGINYTDPQLSQEQKQNRTDVRLVGTSPKLDYLIDTSELLATDLRIYYSFDESSYTANTSGQVQDSHAYNYDATPIDDTSISSTAIISNAALFGSNDDYINVSTNANVIDENYTIAAWFQSPANPSNNPVIFEAYNGTQNLTIYMRTTGTIRVDGQTTGCTTCLQINGATEYNDSSWHHLALTRESTTTATLYIDGSQVAQDTDADAAYINVTDIHISGRSTESFNGYIDEFAMWNRSLTKEEINSLYQRGYTASN